MPGAGILISTDEAAATLLAGVDAFRNSRKRTSSRPRSVEGIAIVGGNAIGEAHVDLYAGDHYFGNYEGKLNGAVAILLPDHLDPIAPTMVAAGDPISAIIAVAPTVSPLKINLYGRTF